jgi:hypothetical protein
MSDHLLSTIANAGNDRAAARDALGWFLNGVFHQDQHSPETHLAVPQLVGLLRPDVQARADVLLALGQLVPGPEWNDLSPESRFWQSDLGENSAATVEAVRRGLGAIETMLADDEIEVRCAAAWVLARLRAHDAKMGREVPGAGDSLDPTELLRARLGIERADEVRVTLRLALADEAGGPSDEWEEPLGALERDVCLVLRARAPIDDDEANAFARLLAASPTPWLPFESGELTRVAARALGRLGRDEPRAFELLLVAYRELEARVAAGPAPVNWSDPRRVDQTAAEYEAGRAVHGVFESWMQVDKLLGWFAFGDRLWGPPLRRDELTPQFREALPLLWGNLQNPPRDTDEAIAAFLRGDSVLDEVITIAATPDGTGITAPVCEHMWAIVEPSGWDQFDAAKLEAFCAAVRVHFSSDRCFELLTRLLAGELPSLKSVCHPVLRERFADLATPERRLAYAAAMTQPLTAYERDLALLLVGPYLDAGTVPPPEFDRAVLGADERFEKRRPWLALFPPERLAALLVQRPELKKLADLCPKDVLGRAVLAAFLSPDCRWSDAGAHQMLRHVDPALLASIDVDADGESGRARAVNAVLAERGVRHTFTVDLAVSEADVVLSVTGGPSLRLPVAALAAATLEPIASHLRVPARRIVHLTGEVPMALAYEVQLLIGKLVAPVEVIDQRGIVLTTGTRDA